MYLFQHATDAVCAVSKDENGCKIPKLGNGESWLPCGEICTSMLPADVIVITNTEGYCLIAKDDIALRNGDRARRI